MIVFMYDIWLYWCIIYVGLFQYELPLWLREEFKASEILLYEHHFSLIDVDKGGSIDAMELQQLVRIISSISNDIYLCPMHIGIFELDHLLYA